jgi:hypothetical protein
MDGEAPDHADVSRVVQFHIDGDAAKLREAPMSDPDEQGLDPTALLALASGYRLSQLIYACTALGLPDLLAAGPVSAEEAAAAIGADADAVARLLRAAASEGVVSHADGRFRLNPFSEQLCRDGEGSLQSMVLGWSALRPSYLAFGHLDEAVRRGRSGIDLAFGERFHEYLTSHPDEASAYVSAMESTIDGFALAAAALDFSAFTKIVDVGGGQGTFLVAIRRRHPSVQGVLFDRPEVVAGAPERLFAYPEGADIEIVGGDMFEDVPADADAYLFSTVLRCFDDGDCERVLRRCAARMRPGGCVLALEMVMPNGIPPSPRGLADLQALVVYGGKDRTDSEWTALLGRAGFGEPRFIAADGPYSFVQAQLA